MSLRYGRKISELNLLTTSSAQTYVLGIDGDASYKLPAELFATAVSDTALGIVNSRLSNLESETGSYLTELPSGVLSSSAQINGFELTGRGIVSESHQLTASFDNRYTLNGTLTYTTWANISSIPSHIISSSNQITSLGFVSGSYETTGRGVLSGSISYSSLTNIPIGIISESLNILPLNEFTQSYYTDSASFDSRLINIETYGDLDPIKFSGSSIYTVTPEAGPTFNTDEGIFFGTGSGQNATNANYSVFIGADTGKDAAYAQSSVFIGDTAGREATNADSSVFIGIQAGHQAINANSSIFIGNSAGHASSNAFESIFMGPSAGENAYSASHAVMLGWQAGYGAQNAEHSVLLGFQAGKTVSGTGIGRNNVIIGNNVTLPENYADYVNLGGVLFVSGTYNQLIAYDPIYETFGGKVGINQLNPLYNLDVSGSIAATDGIWGTIYSDNNVISSSQQISDLGFITESVTILPDGVISSSAQIEGFEITGRGILSGSISYNDLTNIPNGLISSSQQLTEFGYLTTASYNTDSASFDTRIANLNTAIQSGVPSGTISGSEQISNLGFVSGSYETTGRGILSGSVSYTSLTDIPNGIVSGSSQILGGSDVVSGSYETTGRGIISSSTQINQLGFATTSSVNLLSAYTGSYATTSSVNVLSSFTGSYATTGSNTFYGTQIFSGSSYFTGNLIVYGTSSLQNVTASAVNLGTNIIYLNTANPAVRYGGIAVYDSGSSQTTGSLLWDSLHNVWIYVNPEGSSYASARLIAGPTSSVVGNEGGLTVGRLTVAQADDHISSSQIRDDGTNVTIPGRLGISGSITASLANGYIWVGNGSNVSTTIATASLVSSASFNTFTSSQFNTLSSSVVQVQTSLNSLTASLGVTSNAFSYTSVVNPTNYVLVSYSTASYNGGSMDIIVTRASDGTATSINCLLASYGATGDIAAKGSTNSGAGAPNPSFSMALSGGNMNIRISISSGTYNIKGVARLF